MEQVISGNNLSYMGKVELFLLKQDKQIKFATFNEGLAGIAELFTRACLGYPTQNYRPYYVDIRNEDTNESALSELAELRASSFDTIKEKDIEDIEKDGYILGWKFPVFDALIENENIINIDTGYYYIVLLSLNRTPLARVRIKVDKDSLSSKGTIPTLSLRSGNNILVKWSMYLSNRKEEDNG